VPVVQEQAQDGRVAALLEPAALAGLEQPPQRLVIEDRNRVLWNRRRLEATHGLGMSSSSSNQT
jgi:hypothetical protein